jgi:hypothetical protein
LKDGKTGLLEKFVSTKTRRPSRPSSIWKDGKVSFDFPPREPRKPKSAKTAKARAAARPPENRRHPSAADPLAVAFLRHLGEERGLSGNTVAQLRAGFD